MLVVANTVDLSAIASVGSACSLVIFLLVGIAGYRRRAETGAGPDRAGRDRRHGDRARLLRRRHVRNEPETFLAIVAIALLSIILDFLWKRIRTAQARADMSAGGGTVPPSSG